VRFELLPHFSAHLGAGAVWEVLATRANLTPPGPTAVSVFVAGWTLKPGTVFTLGGRAVTAESFLDIVWSDPFRTPGVVGRLHARFALPLFEPISLTVTYDAYARFATFTNAAGAAQGVWGFSGDLSVGLHVAFDRAFQAFAF
jgi:hypothetical protein